MEKISFCLCLILLFSSCEKKECCKETEEYELALEFTNGEYYFYNNVHVDYNFRQKTSRIDSFCLYAKPTQIRISQSNFNSFKLVGELYATAPTPILAFPAITNVKVYANDTIFSRDSMFLPYSNLNTLLYAGEVQYVNLNDYIDSINMYKQDARLPWLGMYFNENVDSIKSMTFFIELKTTEGKMLKDSTVVNRELKQ